MTFIQVVELQTGRIDEFPRFEKAQENSNHLVTAEFAERLAELCDAPPVFRSLDVLREDTM